jgi:hypothetical protein
VKQRALFAESENATPEVIKRFGGFFTTEGAGNAATGPLTLAKQLPHQNPVGNCSMRANPPNDDPHL